MKGGARMPEDLTDAGDGPEEVTALRGEVADLRRQLNEVQDRIHAFVAMLAHELRTPLGAILMWAHVLRMGKDSDRESAVDAIEISARAQSKLIGKLLDVTRALTGRLRIDQLSVDLDAAVRGAVEELQADAADAGVRLTLSIRDAPLRVRGDAVRLRETVAALVENAVRVSPPAGRVAVAVMRAGENGRVTVRDGGPGFSPQEARNMFTAFHVPDDVERRPPAALALELPLARLLAELHGGRLTYLPGPEEGSTFVVEIPLEQSGGDEPV